MKSLEMHWHIPSMEELNVADALLKKFLNPSLDKLDECIEGKVFTRYAIQYQYCFVS